MGAGRERGRCCAEGDGEQGEIDGACHGRRRGGERVSQRRSAGGSSYPKPVCRCLAPTTYIHGDNIRLQDISKALSATSISLSPLDFNTATREHLIDSSHRRTTTPVRLPSSNSHLRPYTRTVTRTDPCRHPRVPRTCSPHPSTAATAPVRD